MLSGVVGQAALHATQGQMDGFFSQLPYKCHPEEVASVEIDSKFALISTPGWSVFLTGVDRRLAAVRMHAILNPTG